MNERSEHEAAALLRAIIAVSPYRDYLSPIEDDVVRVSFLNHQIRAALLAASAAGVRASRFSLRRGADEKLILSFLEYVAFASPGFLASVGEWPLERANG